MNTRFSRLRQTLLFPLLLVVGCNVSDSRDEATPEPGTVLLVPRIIAATGELPRTDSVQIRLEVGDSLAKDTALVWSAGSSRLQGIKYGARWKLTARGFLNPTGTTRWIVWSGSDTGTMSEETKSTTIDRTKFANIVAKTLLTLPTLDQNGSIVPSSIYAGSKITLKANGATSVAWSKDGSTPACNASSTANSVVVPFDSAKTDSVVLKVVACKDSLASEVVRTTFKVVPKPAGFVDVPKPIDTPPDTMAKGDKFRLVPDTGARIAISYNGIDPTCADATIDTATIVHDSTKAGTNVSIRAISCKGTTASQVWTRNIFMRGAAVLAAPSLVGEQNPALTVGGVIRIATTSGVHIAYTTDSSDPSCNGSLTPETVTISVPESSAGDSLVVRALSCKDGKPSGEFRKAFFIPVPKPTLSKKGGTSLGNPVAVGTDIVVKGIQGSKVHQTSNGVDPLFCGISAKDSLVYHVDSIMADSIIVLKSIACKGYGTSAVRVDSIKVLALGAVNLQIESPSGFDTSSTVVAPKITWDSAVTLTIPKGTSLRWRLAVDTLGKVDATDWSKLGVPGATDSTSVKLVVPVTQISRIPGNDSLATVIAVAVLLDSAKAPKDTVHLRWTVRVPVVPAPLVTVARSEGNVSFSWPIARSTSYKAWYTRESSSDTAATIKSSSSTDTVSLTVISGQKVSLRVVATDSATGRSIHKTVDTVAMRPPRKPGFTLENTNTTDGTVVLTLDAATRADSTDTEWAFGYVNSGTVTFDKPISSITGAWTGILNAGTWIVGVRAVRDGLTKESIQTSFKVVKAGPPSPNPVTGLIISQRDTNSLTWKWDSIPGHTYLVYKKSGKIDDLTGMKADTIKVGTYKYSPLKAGDSASIAVVTLATPDSTGGNSAPSFSSIEFAKTPPPALTLVAKVEDPSLGSYRIDLPGYTPLCAWEYGVGRSQSNLAWKSISSADVKSSQGASYVVASDSSPGDLWLGLRATRDTIAKQAVASSALVVPKTSLYTPNAPLGARFTRTKDRIVFRWDGVAGHAYRVFWSESAGSLLAPTDTANCNRATLDVGLDSFELVFGATNTVALRFAVLTAHAPDSTGGPSALSAVNAPGVTPLETIASFRADFSGGKVDVSWKPNAAAKSYRLKIHTTNRDSILTTGYTCTTDSCHISIPVVDWIRNAVDDTFLIAAIGEYGIESDEVWTWTHIPQLRSADRAAWECRIARDMVFINNLYPTGTGNSSPERIRIYLRSLDGRDTAASTASSGPVVIRASTTLGMKNPRTLAQGVGKYRVLYKYYWGGDETGDSTNLDSVTVGLSSTAVVLNHVPPPPIPQGYTEIDIGSRYLTLKSLGSDSAQKPTGTSFGVLGETNGYNLVSLSNGVSRGKYPLTFSGVQSFYFIGTDTSVFAVNEVLAKDSVRYVGTQANYTGYYKTAVVKNRSWMLEPYPQDAGISWIDALGLPSVPTVTGDVSPRQGACPVGWSVPTQGEWQELFTALKPDVNLTRDEGFFTILNDLQTMGANPEYGWAATVVTPGMPSTYVINSAVGYIDWASAAGTGYPASSGRLFCVKDP